VQTDRTILNRKPDIIIRDNEKETCMLIDVAVDIAIDIAIDVAIDIAIDVAIDIAIPGDRNVIKKKPRRF
jgi:hypothetical protein